jgi:hypothetical protein
MEHDFGVEKFKYPLAPSVFQRSYGIMCCDCVKSLTKEEKDRIWAAHEPRDHFDTYDYDLVIGTAILADQWYREQGTYDDDTFDEWYLKQLENMPISPVVQSIRWVRSQTALTQCS